MTLSGLPEIRSNRTNCINNALEDYINPYCNSNSKIAFESLKYACLGTSRCSDNATVSAFSSGTLKRAVVLLSGYQQYAYRVTQSLCTKMHTLMRMTYYCIPGEWYYLIG